MNAIVITVTIPEDAAPGSQRKVLRAILRALSRFTEVAYNDGAYVVLSASPGRIDESPDSE